MKILKPVFLIVIVSFVSCVQARVASYPNAGYPITDPSKIQVYNMKPPVDFDVIGEVEGKGAPAASWDSVYGAMKKEAAKIGGDAIVIVESKREYSGTYNTPGSANAFVYGNYIYYTYNPGMSVPMMKKHIIGVVIKWKRR
jgi:hypothetical protein